MRVSDESDCMSVRQKEFIHLASRNLQKTKGDQRMRSAACAVSKASDWLLLVPNYLLEPRKRWRRRLRVAPGGPTLVWWPPPSPLPPIQSRCRTLSADTGPHSNTPTLGPFAAAQFSVLSMELASRRLSSVMECACWLLF